MCGIAGYAAHPSATPPRRDAIERATRALRHRGPDASGIHVGDRVALANTRLSIIDVAHGDQPLWNEDRSVVVVFNGEIWNHVALRAELEGAGHRFATRADTEVLVHGWEEWGEELPTHLDGMFAFAVWDERMQQLFLARDRLGKKPLYYAVDGDGIAFGSDARSVLLLKGHEPAVDRESLGEYLFQRYVVAPRTMFDGVRKLRPAEQASYRAGAVAFRTYWSPLDGEGAPSVGFRALLRDAVERRLMSDVPVGVLLSGGVDSTAVLGLAREVTDEPLASFTVGFDDPRYDERATAAVVARRFRTEHHEVVVRPADFTAALPRLVWFRDEPIAEASEIPLLLLAELAGAHVKVALSGDGGDELFGGYPKYRADRVIRAVPAAVPALRAAARVAALRPSHRQLGRAVETMTVRDDVTRWASWFRTFGPQEVAALVGADGAAAAGDATLARVLEPYAHLDPGRRMLLGDLLTYLPENMLLRGDKVLMGASVEGRTPLLDRRLVEAATALPIGRRASLRSPKRALREAVADLLPPEVARAPKRGFPVPVARLLLDDPAGLVERVVLSDRALERGLLDPDAVRSLAGGEMTEPDRARKVFLLLSLELWQRANVDRVTLEPPETLADLTNR